MASQKLYNRALSWKLQKKTLIEDLSASPLLDFIMKLDSNINDVSSGYMHYATEL